MSHLFTVKAVQKTDGLDTVTTLHYTTKPYITNSANGGYRVQFEDVNAAPHASPIIFLVGTVNPPREWVKEGEIKAAPDEEFFDNVFRAEAVYIENMAGATVQSLKSNIVKPTPFPEEDRLKNEAIRQGTLKTKTGSYKFYIRKKSSEPKQYLSEAGASAPLTTDKEEALSFTTKEQADAYLQERFPVSLREFAIDKIES